MLRAGRLPAGGQEQRPLGQEVVLHVRLEVEMVLGQVREHGRGEGDRLGAPERQRVRGDLHRARPVAPVEHRPQIGLQVDRLGRRALDRPLAARDHRLDGADQPAAAAGARRRAFEQRAQEIGDRGLAVGAGDTHHAQLAGGVTVEGRRQRRHRRAHRWHEDLGHAEPERALDDQRAGARRHGLGRELVPVALKAAHAEEELAALHSAAVVGETREPGRRRARWDARGVQLRSVEQLLKRHPGAARHRRESSFRPRRSRSPSPVRRSCTAARSSLSGRTRALRPSLRRSSRCGVRRPRRRTGAWDPTPVQSR